MKPAIIVYGGTAFLDIDCTKSWPAMRRDKNFFITGKDYRAS